MTFIQSLALNMHNSKPTDLSPLHKFGVESVKILSKSTCERILFTVLYRDTNNNLHSYLIRVIPSLRYIITVGAKGPEKCQQQVISIFENILLTEV